MKGATRRSVIALLLAVGLLLAFGSMTYAADSVSKEELATAVIHTSEMKAALSQADASQASAAFAPIKKWWTANKQAVKADSLNVSSEIDRRIAAVSLALVGQDNAKALEETKLLEAALINYRDGAYTDNTGQTKMTLAIYVQKLEQTRQLLEAQNWEQAGAAIKQLQQQWLAVEGDVVSQSQAVYSDAERDLVLLDAYTANADQRPQAVGVAKRMIDSLTPYTDAQYSWWDAALIPIREGVEGLLVVGALLMYAKRAGSAAARRWVVGGSSAGILVCLGVGFVVAFLLSSTAFGRNNSLINGWTGVFASFLLLYVSYWLHRNADTKRWKQYLESKSRAALTGGRMMSLALLAFFAIVREGLETVIFLIGMAGKMSGLELAAGIAAGFGVLALLAVIMIKAGSRLPIRPFFLVSSVIVFYLCFKFMGSGIHSLQMGGVLPATVHDYLPDYSALSLYPSWYSTLPQLVFLLAGLTIILAQQTAKRRRVSLQSRLQV
ncbi:FTR1 family iron permease [Paenibacillus athensensis]|uniref:Iron permease FTR1 family protein n=1 Tax=Paenibacillus athensensis TaxID=1967502 RepID=A0A4Y8Q761_9BACL|nr:FTR1 family protein [Paenibacillus athensensis]MCD1257403.1 FTR1 family iron permease [Paenibacillus athensensis]